MTKQGDKSIYIRQEYHERLSRIVQVIGKDEIPLYAYLDNILEHHFEMFEKAIIDDFNEKFKPIFKAPGYGNNNCDLPAHRHYPAFAG